MPPKKKIAALVKVQLNAGAATPAPPVGTALGPHGVNIMEFCKAYNAATEAQRGQVIPVEITVYEDRSFTFVTKTPPAAELIKKARSAAETVDQDKLYAPLDAIRLAKANTKAKFDETVDVAMRLGVDPRKADQMVRGTVNLPHGTGKTARVLVFANAERAEA